MQGFSSILRRKKARGKVISSWVVKVQRKRNILRREGSEGAFQAECHGGLGWGRYGWPECIDVQTSCGGKGQRVHFWRSAMATTGDGSMGCKSARFFRHSAAGRIGGSFFRRSVVAA